MDFLPEDIVEYTERHTEEENEILKDLNRKTWTQVLQPRMLSGHLQGRVLSMLSHMIHPKRILEIGTYTGYSAICLAEGLKKDGILHTIDKNEEVAELATKYINKSGLDKQICLHVGDAMHIVPKLEESWDLVFIDADKSNYLNYYEMLIDHLKSGAYIIADNVLWSGKVTGNYDKLDEETKAIVDFNRVLHEDPRIENVLFPIRDGLMVARIK